MIINKTSKAFTLADFLKSEPLYNKPVRIVLFLITFYLLVLQGGFIYNFYVFHSQDVSFLTYMKFEWSKMLAQEGFLSRHGYLLLYVSFLIFGFRFHIVSVNKSHAKAPLYNQPLLLSWNDEKIVQTSLDDSYKITLYWKDIIAVRKTRLGINLYISKISPLRISDDWFDDEEKKQNFLAQVNNIKTKQK